MDVIDGQLAVATDALAISERELLISTRRFASENLYRSWFELLITLTALVVVIYAGVQSQHIIFSLSVSVVLGLLFVRAFAIYHDFMHSSILKKSLLAGVILKSVGMFLLTPPSVWKRSHDHHHKHNSKLFGIAIGTFRVMTVKEYERATFAQKLGYKFSRSFLTMTAGYLFVFLWGMCLAPLLINPRKHLDCIPSLVLHFGSAIFVFALLGTSGFFFLFAVPFAIATAVGTYLFYVQHNFPGAQIEDVDEWTHAGAALASTSYLECGVLLDWFTANIGFHHVHHLNAKIPFYRLRETHLELSALQTAPRTTLSISDVMSSLRINLWHEDLRRFVSYAEAGRFGLQG